MAEKSTWTTAEFTTLMRDLQDAPLNDPRWEALARGLVDPRFAREAQAALQGLPREVDLLSAGAEPLGVKAYEIPRFHRWGQPEGTGTHNYLGELVHPFEAVDYEPGTDGGAPRTPLAGRVRAFGAGHSSSGAPNARAGVTLLGMRGSLKGPALLPLNDGTLCDGVERDDLVRVRAGATLTEVNTALETIGKALENLPGYSGLTVGGVLNTAVHGSGAALGPLCDLVVSVTLHDAENRLHRIELEGERLTDAGRWEQKNPGGSVFTDPDTFYSVVVGVGCMGVFDDVVLRVRPAYSLTEVHERSTWEQVRSDILAGEYKKHRHYEVLVCPYVHGAGVPCAVLTRHEATARPDDELPMVRRPSEMMGMFFSVLGWSLRELIGVQRGLGPWFVHLLVEQYASLLGRCAHEMPATPGAPATPGTHGGPSFAVLDIGSSNKVKGVATEIAFVMPGGNAENLVAAVDAVLARAAEQHQSNGWIHTLPFSLRFCAASPHYLAMQHGVPGEDFVCCVEMLALHGIPRGEEALKAFQRDAATRGGRAHWGQRNDEMPPVTSALYPKLDAWLRTRARFDPACRFGNEMTLRFGLTPPAPRGDGPGTPRDGRRVPSGRDRAAPRVGHRRELTYDEGKAREDTVEFVLDGVDATEFARRFLGTKSRQSNFGPFELCRAPENAGRLFQVGERFEGRVHAEKVFAASLRRRGVPRQIRDVIEQVLGRVSPVNYYEIKELDLEATADKPARGRYALLEGSPIAGHVEFTARDVAGGCLVAQTLKYAPVGPAEALMMRLVGRRLTRVVGYCEVEITARQLGVKFSARMDPPSEDEALGEMVRPGPVIQTDTRGIVAVKHDVRRFKVWVPAARFVDKFHELLSSDRSFEFFHLRRENYARRFAVGDAFVGVFTPTPALLQAIRDLRPPGRWAMPSELFKALVVRTLRDDPPRDYGKITALQIDHPPYSVRYDYTAGSPIAGHSTFSAEDLPDDGSGSPACLVTQRFVYQEQKLLDVEVFGTVGMLLHNLVVEQEIRATADALGCRWERVDD